jgi:hypothetical protein
MEKENKLAKFLLSKYADIINSHEERTIGEIKTLVDGNDLTIQNIVSEFKDEFYEFEKNYLKVLKEIYEFVLDEIECVDVNFGINYWLSAKEVMDVKVVDDEDMAVFVCAAAKALGDDKAEVIIAELDNLKTHAFVITEFDNKFILLDAASKTSFEKYVGNKADIIKNYEFKGNKIKRFLYRFNSEKYEQFLEE